MLLRHGLLVHTCTNGCCTHDECKAMSMQSGGRSSVLVQKYTCVVRLLVLSCCPAISTGCKLQVGGTTTRSRVRCCHFLLLGLPTRSPMNTGCKHSPQASAVSTGVVGRLRSPHSSHILVSRVCCCHFPAAWLPTRSHMSPHSYSGQTLCHKVCVQGISPSSFVMRLLACSHTKPAVIAAYPLGSGAVLTPSFV